MYINYTAPLFKSRGFKKQLTPTPSRMRGSRCLAPLAMIYLYLYLYHMSV